MRISVAFFVPPPETTNSRKRAGWLSTSGSTNLRTAMPMERAVSAVAVATMSFSSARRQRRRNSRTNSRPNCSRPAVFGGFCRKNGLPQQLPQHALDGLAAGGQPSIAIEGLVEQMLGDGVDHHVAGPGVEGDDLLGQRARRNRREIADAAEVLHDAPVTAMAVEHVIEEGNQRRAFAAGSHVGGTKIGDHRHADLRRDHRRLAGLPGAGDAAPEKRRWRSLVIERLAVAADQFALQPRASLRGANRVGIEFAQQELQPRKIGDAGRPRVHRREHSATHLGRIGKLVMRQQFEARAEAAALDAHQRDVDAVRRGAAHHAGDDHARHLVGDQCMGAQLLR